MSASAIANASPVAFFSTVIQAGTITKVAATPLTVAVPGLLATDVVLLSCLTRTAGTANTPPNEVITNNLPNANPTVTFTSPDAVFAGSYEYVVVRHSCPRVVDAP